MFNNRYKLFIAILVFSFSQGLSAFSLDRVEQGGAGLLNYYLSCNGDSQYIARHIVTWDPPSNLYYGLNDKRVQHNSRL
jgi:hypothetical protein